MIKKHKDMSLLKQRSDQIESNRVSELGELLLLETFY